MGFYAKLIVCLRPGARQVSTSTGHKRAVVVLSLGGLGVSGVLGLGRLGFRV